MARSEQGFTLLEVLIAFAVTTAFATALAGIVSATGQTSERAVFEQATRVAAQTAIARAGRTVALVEGSQTWVDGRVSVNLSMRRDAGLASLWHLTARAVADGAVTTLETSVVAR